MLLSITWANFFGSNFNLYLVYVVGLEPAALAGVNVVLAVANLGARVTCIPLYTRAMLRYPRHAHPARVLAYVRFAEALVMPAMVLVLRIPNVSLIGAL